MTMNINILDFYKAIENTSERMLAAALAQDWDEVVMLEGACAILIEQLREHGSSVKLSAEDRAEKHRIMMTILRHDAQIRELVEPWIDELGEPQRPVVPVLFH